MHGTLSLGSTAGLTFTAGSNKSTTMTVTGTPSSLQAALSGLTFTPTTGYSRRGPANGQGEKLSRSATATVAITVVVPASQPTVTIEDPSPNLGSRRAGAARDYRE